MNEEINQNISQFIDDELSVEESLNLLKKVNNDSALKDKMSRYQLITQVIKNESSILTKSDFLEEVKLALNQEPYYFTPPKAIPKVKNNPQSLVFMLAASVAIVMIMSTKFMGHDAGQKLEATPLVSNDVNILELKKKSVNKSPLFIPPKERVRLKNNQVAHNATSNDKIFSMANR